MWFGGLSTTARQPKAARSITLGSWSVKRWCGEARASADEEPTDETVELCQAMA